MFTPENTTGYSADELTALNEEWQRIAASEGLEPEADAYYAREKQFADDVSRRRAARTEAQRRVDALRIAGVESDDPHPFRVQYADEQPNAVPAAYSRNSRRDPGGDS